MAELKKRPITDEGLRRIAMDILGTLETDRRGFAVKLEDKIYNALIYVRDAALKFSEGEDRPG